MGNSGTITGCELFAIFVSYADTHLARNFKKSTFGPFLLLSVADTGFPRGMASTQDGCINLIFTARVAKAMFSQASVILSLNRGGGQHLPPPPAQGQRSTTSPPGQGQRSTPPRTTPPPPKKDMRALYTGGRYASYWNAFLFAHFLLILHENERIWYTGSASGCNMSESLTVSLGSFTSQSELDKQTRQGKQICGMKNMY